MKRLPCILIILITLGGWLSSCRTQYIPVETIKMEYRTRDSIRYDSIYHRDSMYVVAKGDTVYEYKYKYLYKYQYVNRTDTLIKTDSILTVMGWIFIFVSARNNRSIYICSFQFFTHYLLYF